MNIKINRQEQVRPFTVPNFVVPIPKGTFSRSDPQPAGHTIPHIEIEPTKP